MEQDLQLQFRHKLLDVQEWLAKAKALDNCAATFEHQVCEAFPQMFEAPSAVRLVTTVLPIYFMLAAYAVENILKAFIIKARHAEFEAAVLTNHDLPPQLKSHDLSALAKAAGAQSVQSPERQDLLRRMVRSAVWYGRYPVPLSFDRVEPHMSWFSAADMASVRNLIQDLLREFETTQV